MITAIVYLINGVTLAYFSYKVYFSIRKKYNPFLAYFLGTAAFYSLSMVVYFVLIMRTIITGDISTLYWSDFWGRLLLYIGSIFAIQIPLYKFFPKSKERFIASAIVAVLGIGWTIYNFIYPNFPTIDNSGIIHWNASPVLAAGLAIILLGIWAPTSIIFFTEFVKSRYKSIKSFFLGTGFLMGCLGGIFQDYVRTTFDYFFINILLAFGFILILIGLFYEEK